MTDDERAERRRQMRVELEEFITRNLDVLTPYAADRMSLPIPVDFVLCIAVEDANDGPAEGVCCYGHLASGHGDYRTLGLLRSIEPVFSTLDTLGDDD